MRRRIVALGVTGLVVVSGIALAVGGGGGGAARTATRTTATDPDRVTGTVTAPAGPAPADARVTIAAVGDVMMGTPQFGLPPDDGRDLFTEVADDLKADVVFGNLEGTLTTRGASKCGAGGANCYAFRSPPGYVANLRAAGFTVMGVANNHALDFGSIGQRDTIGRLRGAGIADTGRPGTYALLQAGSVRVAVLAFSTYGWGNRMADLRAARAMVVRAGRRADVVMVSMHAGAEGRSAQHVRPGTEWFLGEDRGDVMRFARAMVDAGADLVVGHGPHVLRAMEFRKGRLIAYSMGNFVGWKGFSLAGESGVTGVLRVTLAADGSFVSGVLRPARLVGSGVPSPGGPAVTNVAALSRDDMGATAAVLDADGAIRAPGG